MRVGFGWFKGTNQRFSNYEDRQRSCCHLPGTSVQLASDRSAAAHRQLERFTGTFQFGPDFYQSNAKVTLRLSGDELILRWPSGDQFIDRCYWEVIAIRGSGFCHFDFSVCSLSPW
jgi:hypothetical protein